MTLPASFCKAAAMSCSSWGFKGLATWGRGAEARKFTDIEGGCLSARAIAFRCAFKMPSIAGRPERSIAARLRRAARGRVARGTRMAGAWRER